MLPCVNAVGTVAQAALFKKINDNGGVISFKLKCRNGNPRAGDPSPFQYHMVDLWAKEGGTLTQQLSIGVPVVVMGLWETRRVNEREFHSIRAREVQVLVGVQDA